MKKEYKKSMIYRIGEKGSRRSEGGEAGALEIIIGEISSVFLSVFLTLPGSFSKSICRNRGSKPGRGLKESTRLKPVPINACMHQGEK